MDKMISKGPSQHQTFCDSMTLDEWRATFIYDSLIFALKTVVLGWRGKKGSVFSKLQKQIGTEQGFCWACAQHRREEKDIKVMFCMCSEASSFILEK